MKTEHNGILEVLLAAGRVFRRKPLNLFLDQSGRKDSLRRVLGPLQLTGVGIGATIGSGIFVMTGVVAHDKAGPALMLSFLVAGLACVFAALCYAELASMVPVAGSAYVYTYATLGELFAWIIGWDLALEYTLGAATVAHGWSKYFQDFLLFFNLRLPASLSTSPFDYDPAAGSLILTGSLIDLPALAVSASITALLIIGVKESVRFNFAIVVLKVLVILLVITLGAFHVDPGNWRPFAPYGFGGLGFFGKTFFGQSSPGGEPLGMLAGAATIFFAYLGFDAVSTQSEEARNPQRDLPIGIIASLLFCTLLYIAVVIVLTGMVPYTRINVDAPVSDAFRQVGLPWAQFVISFGAVAGMTSVLLVLMLSQPRILLAMARDGLISQRYFGGVHERYHTPWRSTLLTGTFVGIIGGFLPIRVLAELVNIGTLFAFVIVCTAVLVMRRTHPNVKRPFRVPLVPCIPVLGILICLLLMFSLPAMNWLRLGAWFGLGLVIYLLYGRHHSRLTGTLDSR